jgi:hypothetical protein
MKAHRQPTPASTAEAMLLTFFYSALVAAYIFLGVLFR